VSDRAGRGAWNARQLKVFTCDDAGKLDVADVRGIASHPKSLLPWDHMCPVFLEDIS